MNQNLIEEKYAFCAPESWATSPSDEELIANLQESEYGARQIDGGKDFCFILNKTLYTSETQNSEYVLMAYTLTQPSNLERASVFDRILEEHELYYIHRISVYRNGQLIDKTADVKIKVLDNENQSDGGVLNSSKKVNVTIKDLRLYDVLILEDTQIKQFTEKDFMRKAFYRYVWISPDVYWSYRTYHFKLINDRKKTILAKKVFYRDTNDQVIEPTTEEIASGSHYEIQMENYNNPVDSNRQVSPFIDFATKATWNEICDFIVPIYEKVEMENLLTNFAPDLAAQLDAESDLEDKISLAIEYVQNHIRYIYNEAEMHGHTPQAPRLTYENKQGDCKAKTMLLKVVLKYIGVESDIVLVNYNTDFYLQFYNPSPLLFNHVIVKIEHKGASYFVDATNRDEYGHLENRNFINFKHYLAIKPHQELVGRSFYHFPKIALEETIRINVQNGIGNISVSTQYRYNRANNMRKYFKNTNQREILDNWYNFLFYSMNYHNDRNEEDKRSSFENSKIEMISDDKKSNELEVLFTATLPKAYFTNREGKRFLMYFDNNIAKQDMKDFNHSDITFWQNYDREKYEIHLNTDQNIDMREKYTIQEIKINNPYFKYEIRKNIQKTGGSAYIEFDPISNLDIPMKDIQQLKTDYHKIADSNYGLGIDILPEEKGFLGKLKSWLK